ncbi:DUF4861 domain-containing protein [Rhodocaloribacter litoris]|uniref:DUF4861 domain-containing protein n=1 Tax=Rhodocaloribacter litoris TaxID=2558931 RepID=UPI00141FC8DC|nr:DUF4861 domain-containing protein [Rhodocaloribacter litoris]QXD14468.1 DUF4861 domain-containing protein [Rhodocaloribacter litoris]
MRLSLTPGWIDSWLLALALACSAVAQPAAVTVRVENPLAEARPDEVVAVSWAALRERLPGLAAGQVRVREAATGREMTVQVVDEDGDGAPDALLWLVHLWPEEVRHYAVEAAAPEQTPVARAYARHDEERDDVAWESDRIAFRAYGQGLWQASAYEPLVSNGIDVWPKRVRDLVLERWYALGHDAYHVDRGEGADFFSVGPSLGGGGTAVWHAGRMYPARNFAAYRILARGPIRAIVELVYEPWDAGGMTVSEVKRITIDAGQHLFRAESVYAAEGADSLSFVVGFVKRPEGVVGAMRREGDWAWLSTWGPVERKNGGHGHLGTAVLMPAARLAGVHETEDHYLAQARARSGEPAVHYVGAGWTASGDFDRVEDWWAYLDAFGRRLAAPLRITLLPSE